MNPGRLIFGFFFGMMLIAFLAIVTEVWWVVAAVGITHIVGSAVLMLLLIRQLGDEERCQETLDER